MTGAQSAVVVHGGVDEPGAVAEVDRTAAEPGGGGIAAVGGIQLGMCGENGSTPVPRTRYVMAWMPAALNPEPSPYSSA